MKATKQDIQILRSSLKEVENRLLHKLSKKQITLEFFKEQWKVVEETREMIKKIEAKLIVSIH
ncbi:MAG TPA: hypothetical protein PKL44_00215 [Candidatus Dojkabacteria bacterium]|nr:hypothetical protein [Candidatus Dojkabacteria bacterium]